MMLRCFAPLTGGRISCIINQESKRGGKDQLPLSKEDDEIEKFVEQYKETISVNNAYERFDTNWEQLKIKAADTTKKQRIPVLTTALFKSYSDDFFKAVCAKLVWSILLIFSIWFFVFKILDFIKIKAASPEKADAKKQYEMFLCTGFFVTMYILSLGIQQMGMYSSIMGSKVKASLTTAIFKKMISRDAYGSHADVVSLVAKDVEKLAEACLSIQYLWSGIFETIAVYAVLVKLLGSTILPGLGLMCIFMPLQYYLGIVIAYKKKNLAIVSSKRISLMEEILRGIKLIKIYGWEDSFFKNLNVIRGEESIMMNRINQIKSAILGMVFCLPPLMCMVVFGAQEATGEIEAVVIFTALSFFNTLRVPFSKLPKSLRDVLDGVSCLERIQSFLLEPDLDSEDPAKIKLKGKVDGITLEKVDFSYGLEAKLVLKNINLNIPQGYLTMVAGPVASGKSNLLKSLLGELTVRAGNRLVPFNKAYVPQTPWTALGTVRDNIVFGKPFDESLYNQVIHACALEHDLNLMTDGDMTWIGERGGNLSGGQKQRIALARAAYSRAELYVLDSPLSAVDMYTCQHIFKHCIQNMMIANGGSVVLATHQTELFSKSDHLIVMKENDVVYNAKYVYEGIKHLFPSFHGDGEATSAPPKRPDKRAAPVKPSTTKQPSTTKSSSTKSAPMDKIYKQNIYMWYIQRMGTCAVIIGTLVFIIGQIMRVYSDNWISVWSQRRYEPAGYTADAFYAGLYSMLVFVFLFLAFLRAFVWYFIGKNGANNIHDKTFAAALKAPMHFYHVTPIGKLLSFFSKDIDTIDDVIVDNVLMLQIFGWILILALGVVSYNLPLYLAVVAVVAVAYLYIVRIFVRTSSPMKVCAGNANSAVIAHTAETLSGLAVVRAFRQEGRFVSDNIVFQERSTVLTYSLANLALWLAYRVDIIGSLLVLICCLLAVLSDGIDAPIAGLIVSNSFQILLFFSIMSRTMGDVQDNIGAVDRARIMADLEAEQEPEREVQTPEQWPSSGRIAFNDVVMPYLPGKPPVLKGVTFSINKNEKIGVVGRTGAGKSSLIVALYRLAEISEGTISVDDIDCSEVKLKHLRRSMAIIPQEPVMFSGTIRTNLDPFNDHTDEALKDVLYKCLLGSMFEHSDDGLGTKVDTMGSNFSLGTQQLICLARAMLNPSPILLLDEATAALDSDTNNAVQVVLKEHFHDRTIFTIAHRLDTIIESDRILTMNAGVIAEFERPDILLETEGSIFRELCMNAGPAQFEVLKSKAKAIADEKQNM